ncbi:MAG: hypothetical protein AAGH15_01935 [Myxococcota bacterium]
MKLVAYALFVSGLLVAVTQAAYIPEGGEGLAARVGAWFDAVGTTFLLGISQMIFGAFLARGAAAAAQPEEPATDGADREGRPAVGEVVARAAGMLETLETKLAPLDAEGLGSDAAKRQALKAALDDVLEDRVPDFLELRAPLIDTLGLESFATMIGHFASMERNAARAWSALTDEAWAEVGPCLERARQGLGRAREALPA